MLSVFSCNTSNSKGSVIKSRCSGTNSFFHFDGQPIEVIEKCSWPHLGHIFISTNKLINKMRMTLNVDVAVLLVRLIMCYVTLKSSTQ
jgi:hypothetical protein